MKIENFLSKVSGRMNLSALIKSTIWCLLIFAGISLGAALIFILRGYAAPVWVFLVAAVAGVLVFSGLLMRSWVRSDAAARFADKFFQLKDGIVSARFLQEETGAAHQLQRNWIENKLESCDPREIPLRFSRKLAILAGVLTVGAITMSFIPASPEVLAQQQEEQETYERSVEAIEHIKKVVEEMDKDLSDEEKEAVDMAEMRKMVDQLEPKSQKEEISRQFAKLEQKAREMSKDLEQKKDEEALKKAIKELEMSQSAETKEIADKMKKGEMKDVKEDLKKLKPEELKPAEENQNKLTQKELDAMKKKLDKMRDVTKRLAAAAQKNKPSKNSPQQNKKNDKPEQDAKAGKDQQNGKKGDEQQNNNEDQKGNDAQMAIGDEADQGEEAGKDGKAQDLDAQMADLDAKAKKLEKLLQELELAEKRDGEMDPSEFNEEAEDFGKMAGKLGEKLQKMQAKRSAKARMKGLSKSMSQAQGFASGQSKSLGNKTGSSMASGQSKQSGSGGLKPGSASQDNRKSPGEELENNGNLQQLTGQKGDGPSNSKIEEAQSGTGVSSNRTTAKAQDFSRQMEAFIERDSVPEDLKQGVKQYFKTVHDIETTEQQK